MNRILAGLIALAILPQTALAQDAAMGPLRPDQVAFRALYKELVETNTTLSAGSCTLASQRMAAHLKAAGFPDADVTLFAAPDHPKEGGLVAILPGQSQTRQADPASRPSGCGGSQARRLDPRPVHAGRGE